jgi:hypothetical protein
MILHYAAPDQKGIFPAQLMLSSSTYEEKLLLRMQIDCKIFSQKRVKKIYF